MCHGHQVRIRLGRPFQDAFEEHLIVPVPRAWRLAFKYLVKHLVRKVGTKTAASIESGHAVGSRAVPKSVAYEYAGRIVVSDALPIVTISIVAFSGGSSCPDAAESQYRYQHRWLPTLLLTGGSLVSPRPERSRAG